MLPALLLAALLAIVLHGFFSVRGFSARFADLFGRTSRSRVIVGFAVGTALVWAMPAVVALALLGRLDTLVEMPDELRQAAWDLGLPAGISPDDLAWLGLCLAVGVGLGIAIILIRRWRGKRSFGLPYRSPLAARDVREFPAAALLALAAGVGEEIFFRLALPLLVAIVSGSGVAGVAMGLVAFVALHRHQGWVGLVAVALVGAGLTYLYLLTGLLWVVIALHAAIDLNAFVLRPWLAGFAR